MNETNIEHPTSNAEHRTWGDAALRMTNDESRMTKEIRNPNDEGKTRGRARTGSTFVIRISTFSRALIQMRNAECGIKQLTTDD